MTPNENWRFVQTVAATTKVPIVAARVQDPDELRKVANFSGSSIINDDFFVIDTSVVLTGNFAGSVNEVQLGNETVFSLNEEWISNSLLPAPTEVVQSFGELWTRDNLPGNLVFSIYLNLMGYLIALLVALPLGFIIGLVSAVSRPVQPTD